MTDRVGKGSWVEIHQIVLPAAERAPQVPDDTRQVPLEMRVKGYLLAPAAAGEEADVVTAVGRRLRGVIREVNPAYSHGFGAPIAELCGIGREVRALLRGRRQGS